MTEKEAALVLNLSLTPPDTNETAGDLHKDNNKRKECPNEEEEDRYSFRSREKRRKVYNAAKMGTGECARGDPREAPAYRHQEEEPDEDYAPSGQSSEEEKDPEGSLDGGEEEEDDEISSSPEALGPISKLRAKKPELPFTVVPSVTRDSAKIRSPVHPPSIIIVGLFKTALTTFKSSKSIPKRFSYIRITPPNEEKHGELVRQLGDVKLSSMDNLEIGFRKLAHYQSQMLSLTEKERNAINADIHYSLPCWPETETDCEITFHNNLGTSRSSTLVGNDALWNNCTVVIVGWGN